MNTHMFVNILPKKSQRKALSKNQAVAIKWTGNNALMKIMEMQNVYF